MNNKFIEISRSEGVTTITLSDPATRNALSPEMAIELYKAFDSFESNVDERVLVITGADPSFCSGANIKKFDQAIGKLEDCLLYTSPSPRDGLLSRMPSSA